MKLVNVVRKTGWTVSISVLLSVSAVAQALPSSEKLNRDLSREKASCDLIKTVADAVNSFSEPAPDGRSLVCVKEDKATHTSTFTSVYLIKNRERKLVRRYEDIGPSGGIVWSPDSSRFVFNWTSGGTAGQWHIDLFDGTSGKRRAFSDLSVLEIVRKYGCGNDPDNANAIFLRWDDNTRLTVAIEPHPAADCSSKDVKDTFVEVEVPSGRIVREYKGQELEKLKAEFAGKY